MGGPDAARRSATTRPVPGSATGSPGSDRTHNMATFPRPPRTHRPRRWAARTKVAAVLVGAVSVLTAACSSGATNSAATTAASPATTTGASTTTSTSGLPGIRHVFLIVLENEGFDATFGTPSADPYLAGTLPAQGALLTNYYGIGHFSNDNYIALISGQAPNPLNQADCQVFANFPASATVATNGQMSDSGWVFPTTVTTVADHLTQAQLTWKGYKEYMGNIPFRESAVCGHSTVGAGQHRRLPPDLGAADHRLSGLPEGRACPDHLRRGRRRRHRRRAAARRRARRRPSPGSPGQDGQRHLRNARLRGHRVTQRPVTLPDRSTG